MHAFARRFQKNWIVISVPRLLTNVAGPGTLPIGQKAWRWTALVLPSSAPKCWVNVLSGEPVTPIRVNTKFLFPVGQLFLHLPFAVIAHVPANESKTRLRG